MKQRKSHGGRHVAIERGLRPHGSGLPFRRELRELAAMLRSERVPRERKSNPSAPAPRLCVA